MLVLFKDKFVYDRAVNEAIVLDSGLWLYQGPGGKDLSPINLGSPAIGADGRCAICHPFSEGELQQMAVLWDEEIQTGDIEFHDELPEDWKWPEPVGEQK